MQSALRQRRLPLHRQLTGSLTPPSPMDMLRARQALKDLKALHEQGLLGQADFERAQADIIQRATGAAPAASSAARESAPAPAHALITVPPPPPPPDSPEPAPPESATPPEPAPPTPAPPPSAAASTAPPPPPPPPDTPPTSDDEGDGNFGQTQAAAVAASGQSEEVRTADDIGLEAIRSRLIRRMRVWFASVDIGGNERKNAAHRQFDIRRETPHLSSRPPPPPAPV